VAASNNTKAEFRFRAVSRGAHRRREVQMLPPLAVP
jgi:hypothetical protein